jgi:hypothetical protein
MEGNEGHTTYGIALHLQRDRNGHRLYDGEG